MNLKKTLKSAKNSRASTKANPDTLSDVEREAMRERARELKAGRSKKVDFEVAVLAKIAGLPQPDRESPNDCIRLSRHPRPGSRLKPGTACPRTANEEGKIVRFFQPASKLKTRYSTLGFLDTAHLDDGTMWATSFALTELSPDAEETVRSLIQKAVG